MILSVICSGLANGLGRVVVFAAAAVVVVLPTVIYPIVGEVLKSSVMVDMVRFSDVLMALFFPAIL